MTNTTVENMPCNWDSSDDMGEGWEELGIDPGATWREMFEGYLEENYPDCSLVGDEIYGPATYRYPDANVQRDTPAAAELVELPDDGIYAEFQAQHENSWSEDIEEFATGG